MQNRVFISAGPDLLRKLGFIDRLAGSDIAGLVNRFSVRQDNGCHKKAIILLNKSDLSDTRKNKLWMEYFAQKGFHAVEINSRTGAGVKSIQGVVQEACKEKIERDRRRGIINRPVRAMVVGIPNVGKSTFINSFAGKACAKTGNKPGVTKGKQWIRLNKGLELLDTPGILWPKFEDQTVGLHLAMIGSMNDEIVHLDELAYELIKYMREEYPGLLEKRYDIEIPEDQDAYDTIKAICVSRKCFLKGEELDIMKASSMVVDDFRNGRIGKITLEIPQE